MAIQNSPYFGIKWGWALGADGWNNGMDENLLVLSFLNRHAVDSFVPALPIGPAHGSAYVLTTDQSMYFRVNDSWVFVEVPVGYEFTVLEDGTRWVRSDVEGGYEEIPTTAALANSLGDTSGNVSGVSDRVTLTEENIDFINQELSALGQDASSLPVSTGEETFTLSEWMSFLADRENHVSTQTADTISDFAEAAEVAVSAALTSDGSVEFDYDTTTNLITVKTVYSKSEVIPLTSSALDLSEFSGGSVIVDLDQSISSILLPLTPEGIIATLEIVFKQDVVGGHVVEGWTGVDWIEGIAPSIKQDPEDTTVLRFTNANGRGWLGQSFDYAMKADLTDVIATHEEDTDPHPQYAPLVEHKKDATVVPTITDDESLGYEVFSMWKNSTNNSVFLCLDASAGAAVWKQIAFVEDVPEEPTP